MRVIILTVVMIVFAIAGAFRVLNVNVADWIVFTSGVIAFSFSLPDLLKVLQGRSQTSLIVFIGGLIVCAVVVMVGSTPKHSPVLASFIHNMAAYGDGFSYWTIAILMLLKLNAISARWVQGNSARSRS